MTPLLAIQDLRIDSGARRCCAGSRWRSSLQHRAARAGGAESGCGKTTTGRLLLRMTEPDAGEIRFDGMSIGGMEPAELRRVRQRMQIVSRTRRTRSIRG